MRFQKSTVLVATLLGQAVCELLSTVVPPRAPVAIGVVFALLFAGTALLVRRGRLAGLLLAAPLGLFLVTRAPTWPRPDAVAWVGAVIAGALALCTLVMSCALLVERVRSARPAELSPHS